MKNSNISWTDHTFNPWIGCSKVSCGCKNCYAEFRMAIWLKRVEWGPHGTRKRTSPDNWLQPERWNAEAKRKGIRYRVFTASLADVFEDRAELLPWRDELHDLIRRTPHLDWLLLTKRPAMAAEYYKRHPLPGNVWLGTSVEDQAAAGLRIPILASIPVAIRFLSCEPLLAEITNIDLSKIGWLITGGESGPGFRPMKPEWAQSSLLLTPSQWRTCSAFAEPTAQGGEWPTGRWDGRPGACDPAGSPSAYNAPKQVPPPATPISGALQAVAGKKPFGST